MNARTRHLHPGDLAGKRYRGLIRESTERQSEKWSPEAQRDGIEQAAERLGMTGDGKWYVRTGSGEAVDAPELAQALVDGLDRQYDVLVVYATSRFARNRAEAVRQKALFQGAGIVIYFVAEDIVSGSYASALTEGLHELLDEHANEERRMWIAGGARQRQLAGRWIGNVPTGYRKVMVDQPNGSRRWEGELEIDPVTGPFIIDIFKRRARGASYGAIGTSVRRDRAIVKQMISNPAYMGRLTRYRQNTARHYFDPDTSNGKAEIAGAIPALVSESLFRRANYPRRSHKSRAQRTTTAQPTSD